MDFQFPFFPVLFTSLLFLLFVFRMLKKSKADTPNLPPGPKKLPIIGNLHQLARSSLPHYCLRDLAKKYGSIMHLQLGEVSNIVITSMEGAKEVMKTHDIIFASRPPLFTARIVAYDTKNISFAPYGEYWRQLRKICTLELLSAKRVQSFRSIREEEVSNVVSKIASSVGLPFNLSRLLFSLTYGVVSRASFGKKHKDQEGFIPVSEQMIETASGFSLPDLFPSIKFLEVISGNRSKLERLGRESDRILQSIIDEHRAKTVTRNADSELEEDDLVDILLKLQENGGLEFTLADENIKAVILDVFVAGSETSSSTVEWAMSEMIRNPRVMKKAQAEVRKVCEWKGKVDESNLQELVYLKLVIKETLRLHPPVPLLLPREIRERCEINGYEIPAKSKVIVNAWAIGRDPKYWTEAETFYPERFQDSSVDFRGTNFEFIPFGAGRRMCPGMLFGIANVELPLANLLYHFEWELPGNQKLETLDMSESFGATVRRKNDLQVVPIPYQPMPVQ